MEVEERDGTARINRRDFLRRLLAGGVVAGAGAGGMLYYANEWEPFHPLVEQHTIPLAGLPASLEGMRIAQISDMHVGPSIDEANIDVGVALINAQRPDLIVTTGDYVTRWAGYAEACARALAKLQAPLGVWGILGNHDMWAGPGQITQKMRAVGIRMLINACAQPLPDIPLWLIGLDDIWSGRPDLLAALASVPDEGVRILLAHEPDFADTAARPEFGINVQLSGHSHGGQVRLPGIGAPILPYLGRKYDIGLRHVNQMWLYTNRGLGMVEPPIRFNCPPEVSVFTLTRVEPPTGKHPIL